MKERLSTNWKKVPRHLRRPIVLTVGLFFVLLSGAVGWLPGPGGIPIFLLGIAILSSEFHWAERIKNMILDMVYTSARWIRSHKVLGFLFIVACLATSSTIAYMLLHL